MVDNNRGLGGAQQGVAPARAENHAETILRAGQIIGAGSPRGVEPTSTGTPFVIVPDGFRIESLQPLVVQRPRFYARTHQFGDAESFIRFVKDRKAGPQHISPGIVGTEEAAVVECSQAMYYSVEPPRFTHIFNEHDYSGPNWRDYRAVYECPHSPEWKLWTASNNQPFQQDQFAQFIENNIPDIVSPAAADMLTLSRTLEAKKAVNFASSIRLGDGATQLTYEETIDGTANKGAMKIIESFVIGIPVFKNGPGYKIECRFRYRISGARLSLWYEMVRPHKILDHAIGEVRDKIAEGTGIAPFLTVGEV